MSNESSSNGMGLAGFVFLIFLVLKLTEIGPVAAWSWWWVTAPLWGGLALALSVLLLGGLWFAASSLVRKWWNQ